LALARRDRDAVRSSVDPRAAAAAGDIPASADAVADSDVLAVTAADAVRPSAPVAATAVVHPDEDLADARVNLARDPVWRRVVD
jgi:hypothetical protein